jgi:hypothetical protein
MKKFVICLDNRSNPESLIVGKVYLTLPDKNAAKAGLIRVLDETYGEPGSEDGYLYPQSMFTAITLPKAAENVLENVYT